MLGAEPMAEPDNQLQIRCPKCSQRFKVGPELEGKIVECGRCESRFRVDDSVILKQKKFYPGEKQRDPSLDRFARTPVAPSVVQPVSFQTVSYEPEASPESFEPPSVQRLLAGTFGGGILLLAILAFLTSDSTSGTFSSVSGSRRLILAVFVALLGSSALVYANPRAKLRALAISLLLSATLIALPLILPGGAEPAAQPASNTQAPASPTSPSGEEIPVVNPLDALRAEIGYAPMELELSKAKDQGSVVGVWLRNMQERHRFQVRDFLLRASGAGESSHLYPRTDTSFLYVLNGVPNKLEEIAGHCARIGRVERIIRPLQVIEVVVDNQRFVEGPIDRLSNRKDEGFYALNLAELDSIDLDRSLKAVERLSDAEPVQFRTDIVRRMVQLSTELGPEHQDKIAKALQKWSVPGDDAEQAILKGLLRLAARKSEAPGEMVRFLVLRRNPGVLPVLHQAWLTTPEEWESLYAEMGAAAEESLLEVVAGGDSRACRSAVRILERVGTGRSTKALELALTGSSGEFRVLLERALKQVRSRSASP
jgi:hypothetical protein